MVTQFEMPQGGLIPWDTENAPRREKQIPNGTGWECMLCEFCAWFHKTPRRFERLPSGDIMLLTQEVGARHGEFHRKKGISECPGNLSAKKMARPVDRTYHYLDLEEIKEKQQ